MLGKDIAIFISNKTDFKSKFVIRRDSEGHYKLTKAKLHQENTEIFITYALNSRSPKFIKETPLKFKSRIDLHNTLNKKLQYPILTNRQKLSRKMLS